MHYIWDPIGVAYTPAARDEYQEYLPRVFAMLQESASVLSVATYLDEIAIERMGVDAKPTQSKRVAELLIDWKAEITGTCGASLDVR